MNVGVGDTAITIRKVAELFGTLKAAYDAKDDEKCHQVLEQLKKPLIFLPTFLNPSVEVPTRIQELMLAREVLEHGVLVSTRRKNLDDFDLYFRQLRVYYDDVSDASLPQSAIHYLVLGLNLMRLLVSSRIAEFHSELAKLPHANHSNLFVKFAVQMERYLMEGSYNKLLHARSQAPSHEYTFIVELLETTVRTEVALCIPKSYTSLTLADAQKLLMLRSTAEVQSYGKQFQWQTSPDGVRFVFAKEDGVARKELPFLEMLQEHINFAAELQSVV